MLFVEALFATMQGVAAVVPRKLEALAIEGESAIPYAIRDTPDDATEVRCVGFVLGSITAAEDDILAFAISVGYQKPCYAGAVRADVNLDSRVALQSIHMCADPISRRTKCSRTADNGSTHPGLRQRQQAHGVSSNRLTRCAGSSLSPRQRRHTVHRL